MSVIGLEHLQKQLEQLIPQKATRILKDTLASMASEMVSELQATAPVDSGTLRAAVVASKPTARRGKIEANVKITKGRDAANDAWYWHIVEFGSMKWPSGRPFIVKAIERARPGVARVFETQFFAELERQTATKTAVPK